MRVLGVLSTVAKGFQLVIPNPVDGFRIANQAIKAAHVGDAVVKDAKALKDKIQRNPNEEILVVDGAVLMAKDLETYYEVIAQGIVYQTLKAGDRLPKSTQFEMVQYVVHQVMEDRCGMRALFLVPEEKGVVSPLLVFRGTDPKNIHNVLDDLKVNPAELNFKRQKEALGKELEELSQEYGAFHVLGHSFGAAMAQRTTAEFPEYIARCISYNGLQPGEKIVEMFQQKLAQYPDSMPKPEVWAYRHAKDVVSLLGGEGLPTTPEKHYTFGSVKDDISHIDAHSVLALSKGLPRAVDTPPDREYREVAAVTEVLRKGVGTVIGPIHSVTARKK